MLILWAADEPDAFRIMIWREESENEHVNSGNGMSLSIGGGSIAMHAK